MISAVLLLFTMQSVTSLAVLSKARNYQSSVGVLKMSSGLPLDESIGSAAVNQIINDVKDEESQKKKKQPHSSLKLIKSFAASCLVFGSLIDGGAFIQPSVAATQTSAGLETTISAFEKAENRAETVQAFADLYEAAGQKTLLTRTKYKSRIIKAINEKRGKLSSDWDSTLGYESGELKRRVDPYRTVDLSGYLAIAPFLGGAYYLATLFVQQSLPELFTLAYPLAVFVFTAPIIFIIVAT